MHEISNNSFPKKSHGRAESRLTLEELLWVLICREWPQFSLTSSLQL